MTHPAASQSASPTPSVLLALVALAWPFRVARHAERVTWIEAWLIHAASAVAFVLAASWAARTADTGRPIAALLSTWESFTTLGDQVAVVGLPSAIGLVVAQCLAVEAGVVIAAYLLAPFASRDEPVGQAFARTLKRLLVTTPWLIGAVPILAAAGGLAAALAHSLGIAEHNVNAVAGIIVAAAGITLAWLVPLLIARVGRTDFATCRWPLTCEGCGYTLIATADDHPCPECGRLRRNSVGPHIRPGVTTPTTTACLQAIATPWLLGRSLRVGQLDNRCFDGLLIFAIGVALATPIAAGLVLLTVVVVANEPPRFRGEDIAFFFTVCALFASIIVAAGVGVVAVSAAIAGSLATRLAGRNLLPAAAQAAAWAAPALILAPLLIWLGAIVAICVVEFIDSGTPNWALLATLTTIYSAYNLLVPIGVALGFLAAVFIATRHARYANR
ncbi:MAG: hypothetical protein AAF823_15140 [Planctomycetota bacterium]